MIIEHKPNLLDSPNGEDPPAYDTLASSSSISLQNPRGVGPSTPIRRTPSYFPNDSKSPQNPRPTSPKSGSSISPSRQKSPAGWLAQLIGTPQAKQDKEVKQTVLGLLRGVIQQGDGQSSNAIIQCCIDACRTRGLSFESITQERSVQGHTPLYWTIVKIGSPSNPSHAQGSVEVDAARALSLFDLLTSFPLTQDTYSDALQACLLTSSHATFQLLLPHCPTPPPTIPGEEVVSVRYQDLIDVFNGDDVEAAITGAFRVRARIRDFQRRLRVLKELSLDFIARGRMWRMKFFIWSQTVTYPGNIEGVKNGAWVVMLDLIEDSPDTWLDSRLTIGKRSDSIPLPSTALPQPTTTSSLVSPPPLQFRMKSSREYQLSGLFSEKRWGQTRGPVVHVLSDNAHGSSLQFDGCPYINEDGNLDLLLEAKLVKPERNAECTFM